MFKLFSLKHLNSLLINLLIALMNFGKNEFGKNYFISDLFSFEALLLLKKGLMT